MPRAYQLFLSLFSTTMASPISAPPILPGSAASSAAAASAMQELGDDAVLTEVQHHVLTLRLDAHRLRVQAAPHGNDSFFCALGFTGGAEHLRGPLQWRRAITNRLHHYTALPSNIIALHGKVGNAPTAWGLQAAADVASAHLMLFTPGTRAPRVFSPASLRPAARPICVQWTSRSRQGKRNQFDALLPVDRAFSPEVLAHLPISRAPPTPPEDEDLEELRLLLEGEKQQLELQLRQMSQDIDTQPLAHLPQQPRQQSQHPLQQQQSTQLQHSQLDTQPVEQPAQSDSHPAVQQQQLHQQQLQHTPQQQQQ